MFKKKIQMPAYDAQTQRPVIRASICTGEQVAGFKEKGSGKFTEVMLIRNSKDFNDFLELYQLEASQVSKEY